MFSEAASRAETAPRATTARQTLASDFGIANAESEAAKTTPSLSEATPRAETAPRAATARQALASEFRFADAEAA